MKASPILARFLPFIGFVFLAVILLRTDLSEFYGTVANARLSLLLPSVFLIPGLIFFKALRWRFLVEKFSGDYSLARAFTVYTKAIFLGLMTPGRIGEFSKIYYLRNHSRISVSQAFATVLLDRAFDVFFLLCAGLFALALLPGPFLAKSTLFVIALVILLLFSILLSPGLRGWLIDILQRQMWLPEKARHSFDSMLRFKSGTVLACMGMTCVSYLFFYLLCYLAALSLDLGAPLWVIVAASSLGNFAAMLPISFYGLGTREAAVIAVMSFAGRIAEADALSFSLLLFFLFYLGTALFASLVWILFPLSESRVWQGREGADEK